MNATSKKLAPCAVAVVCLALASPTLAGDDAHKSKDSTYKKGASEMMGTTGAPAKVNKASGFIGMSVRNQNDEHLGHIKDLVFDLKTERVAYAVLTTAPRGLPGINEKLLAVPINAFTVSADEKSLILRAEKSKIETAAGFDKNSWPDVSNPSWGAEPFWQTDTMTPGSRMDKDATKSYKSPETGKDDSRDKVQPRQSPPDQDTRPNYQP